MPTSECYLFLTFDMAGLTHTLKGVSLRPPICQALGLAGTQVPF